MSGPARRSFAGGAQRGEIHRGWAGRAQTEQWLAGDGTDGRFTARGITVDAQGRVVPAGAGAVDLPGFVARIHAAGYVGPLVGHGFAAADAPAVAAYLTGLIASTRP